jgi:membrane-bound O-acyltransferase GUP1_2
MAHPIIRRAYHYFFAPHLYRSVPNRTQRSSELTQGLSPSAAADARLDHRTSFDFYFGLTLIAALHGFSSLKVFLILYANYRLGKGLHRGNVPMVTWIFNISVLFANEFCRGYPYARISHSLGFIGSSDWGAWLDAHGGLIPRWEVLFNFTILRMISFNMDYYWSLNSNGSTSASNPLEV